MKKRTAIQAIVTAIFVVAFGCASAVVFVFGKGYFDSDWLILTYVVGAFLYLIGLLGVIVPQAVFRMFYNKLTCKAAEKSETEYVAPEYMSRNFFMKFRWGLLGFGSLIVIILDLVVVLL